MNPADQLTLPATLDSLAQVREFVRDAAARADVDRQRTYNLQLALDEITTNVIVYGYAAAAAGKHIVLHAEKSADSLVITLEDWGPPFDPRTRELPDEEDLSRPLEERSIGGLGIFLAVKGVDRFDYRRDGDRNLNIFEVRSGATAP